MDKPSQWYTLARNQRYTLCRNVRVQNFKRWYTLPRNLEKNALRQWYTFVRNYWYTLTRNDGILCFGIVVYFGSEYSIIPVAFLFPYLLKSELRGFFLSPPDGNWVGQVSFWHNKTDRFFV
jgi:hypothetical protein